MKRKAMVFLGIASSGSAILSALAIWLLADTEGSALPTPFPITDDKDDRGSYTVGGLQRLARQISLDLEQDTPIPSDGTSFQSYVSAVCRDIKGFDVNSFTVFEHKSNPIPGLLKDSKYGRMMELPKGSDPNKTPLIWWPLSANCGDRSNFLGAYVTWTGRFMTIEERLLRGWIEHLKVNGLESAIIEK